MDDRSAVEAVIRDYFDALYDGDAAKFGRLFHPACRLFTVGAEGVATLGYEDYLTRVAGRPSPRSRGDARIDEIVALTVAGPTLAHARVKDCYLPGRYISELTLLKTGGAWTIVAKAWHVCA